MKRPRRRGSADVEPILKAIVRTAARLCDANYAHLHVVDGTELRIVAKHGTLPHSPSVGESLPLTRGSVSGRAVVERRTVHVRDMRAVAKSRYKDVAALQRAVGLRTLLATPLLQDGRAVGALVVLRKTVRPFTPHQIALLKTFAEQAAIALENARLSQELQASNHELSDSLTQQTATAEILRVISSSPTDIQPVLDAVVQSAARLCGASDAVIYRRDDDRLRLLAYHGSLHAPGEIGESFPLVRGVVVSRTVLEVRVLHIADLQAETDDFPEGSAAARRTGMRAILSVPLMREGIPFGAISVRRAAAKLFTEQQVTLLQTFADQAVIAIENVRLFTEAQERNAELTESLEQQTATGEILRVISSSPTEIQPVLDAVVTNASRFCGAYDASIFLRDGDTLRVAAHHGPIPAPVLSIPVVRGSVGGRSALERRPVHVADLQAESEEYPEGSAFARECGHRATLSVPLLREGEVTGVIQLRRLEADPFTDRQIALLQTFTDQAVIAIENVRLFKELETRNGELTEALEQQTATSEILRVISSSPTDLQPVFDIIAESAAKLCSAEVSVVTRFDGEWVDLKAVYGSSSAGTDALRRAFPMRPTGVAAAVRAVRDRAIAHIPDVLDDAEYGIQEAAVAGGFRAALAVPMLREGRAIGSIGIGRSEAGEFSERQIKLLRTFADQALIAIENVRLFKALEARNTDLTEALEQQTATADILRVIGSSPTDVQPVFDAIVTSAARLLGCFSAVVFRLIDDEVHLAAYTSTSNLGDEQLKTRFPRPLAELPEMSRTLRDRTPFIVEDVEADVPLWDELRRSARVRGYRSLLTVPLVHEGSAIGAIGVTRRDPGPFAGEEIALLQTFADQAVIAIENVRLFKELQARTRELSRSVDQLTALGEISQAVSSTLDVETVLQTIVSRASQLAGADGCAIYEYDDATEAFHIRATHNLDPVLVGTLRAAPLRKGEGTMGRAAETREPIQVADIAVTGAYQSHIRDTLLGAGYRALLSVPLLREGEIIGSLSLNRHAPGDFPPEVVEVLKTFATQSALAIQNARLFREIADKSRQLEAASRHKSEFLANMSHELRTPLNAIIGFSEVLNERMFGELNDKQAEYLKDIHASGTHLLSLINDILDLSKVEAGRMELELSDFSLPAAIDSALTLVRERATRRGVTLRAAVHDGVGEVSGDERKIRQVLLNLLSNAIKFTPEGGRIEVKAVPEGGVVDVSVSDTGVGIAPEDHEAVFEEFRQVGASAAKQEGTGLGLALCRKFVELHGGKIWVTSALGVGSTFTFRLPVRQ
jgi:GAF domain-containing protein